MPSDSPCSGTSAASPRTCTRQVLLAGSSALLVSPAADAFAVPEELGQALALAESELAPLQPGSVRPSAVTLFRAWDTLFARINNTGTPEPEARALRPKLEALRQAIEAEPITSLTDLAAKVLTLTSHGEFELPESLVGECEAIVRAATL